MLQRLLDLKDVCTCAELREFLSHRSGPQAGSRDAVEFGDITAPNREGESSLPAYLRRGMNVISTVAVDTLVKPLTEAIDEMFPTPAPPSDANKVRPRA